jgi:uncharacterized protein
MKLDTIFSFLVPKDRKFFPLFIEAADNVVFASELLVKLIKESNSQTRQGYITSIRKAELKGDQITLTLMNELNGTFITPFEREDIHKLVDNIDSIIDLMHSASKRIQIYNVSVFPKEFLLIAEKIQLAVLEIQKVLRNVKNVNDFSIYSDSCTMLSNMKSEVDDIYQNYLANLFEKEINAIELIKKRDILTALEKAIHKCDDVGNVFSTLIVKMG